MSGIHRITDLSHPALAPYGNLADRSMRRMLGGEGVFVAESPKVIRVALDAGYVPLSLLCEERHLSGDAADIAERCRDIDIFTGERELLASLTGYTLTRGVLCAMKRLELPSVAEICREARRVAVIDSVTDTTNIGSIFRAAAALGIDAVLLTTGSCDPLNRRSIRVSMGSVFLVPWTWLSGGIEELHALGFTSLALALKPDALSLGDASLQEIPKAAIVVGTEGEGLSDEMISKCSRTVIIPMSHSVDSLNVATAAAVAFWQLRMR